LAVPLIAKLRQATVIAPDLRGFGESPRLQEGDTKAAMPQMTSTH